MPEPDGHERARTKGRARAKDRARTKHRARAEPGRGAGKHNRRSTGTRMVALAGLGILVLGPALLVAGWYALARSDPDPGARPGTEVRSGPVTFQVRQLRCGPDADGTTNGRRCEITVRARNGGDQDVTVPGSSQHLHAPEGVRYLPQPADPEPFGTLEPGDAATTVLIFDIPPGVPVSGIGVRSDAHVDARVVAFTEGPLPLPEPSGD